MSKSLGQAITHPNAAMRSPDNFFDVLVIGGGSAGIGVTASLLRRRPSLKIAIVEPNDKHYYQPARLRWKGRIENQTARQKKTYKRYGQMAFLHVGKCCYRPGCWFIPRSRRGKIAEVAST